MTLVIVPRDGATKVAEDLRLACPEPGLSISGSGVVKIVNPTTICGRLVSALEISSSYTGLRVEQPTFRIFNPSTGVPEPISAFGGVTAVDRSAPTPTVQIIYDRSNCNGNGFFTMGERDGGNGVIDMPLTVILVHELAHAAAAVTFQDSNTGNRAVDSPANEAIAIGVENQFRAERGLPKRTSHVGACKAPAEKPKQEDKKNPPGSKPGCFVATAAHGSALHPDVEGLRQFRDGVVRRTRMGQEFFERFFSLYSRVSPQIIDVMESNPEVRTLVRQTIVSPIVRYLALFETFPDAPIEDVAEPWRSWLLSTRDNFEQFVDFVPLPHDFSDLTAEQSIDEINLVLRYGLRGTGKRRAWLQELVETDELPLRFSSALYAPLHDRLLDAGRSGEEITMILGDSAQVTRHHAVKIDAAFGDVDYVPPTALESGQWYYTVTIVNNLGFMLPHLALFYKRRNMPGVVFLSADVIQPGEVVIFRLGICSEMESYVFGLFDDVDGDGEIEEVMKFPESGNFTAAMGAAREGQACEDSFSLG